MIDKHQPKSPSSVAKSTLPQSGVDVLAPTSSWPSRGINHVIELPVDNMVLPLTLKPEIARYNTEGTAIRNKWDSNAALD